MKLFPLIFVLCGGCFFGACTSTTTSAVLEPEKTDKIEISAPISLVYVIPGDYYEMLIGLDKDVITGIYRAKTEEGESPAPCFFFFEGRVGENNPVKFKCYNPLTSSPPISGNFKILGEDIFVKLNQLPRESCSEEFVDNVGHVVVLDLPHKWKAIRVVGRQVPIYVDDMKGLELGDKLPKGAIVAVKEKKGQWLRVDVPELDYGEEGWIHQSALLPLLEI